MDETAAGEGLALVFLVIYGSMICMAWIVPIICFWRIIDRSGRSGPIALLMLIPIVNFGVMIWAAFGNWPIERKGRDEEEQWR